MDDQQLDLLRGAINLLHLYKQNPTVRRQIQEDIAHNRPIRALAISGHQPRHIMHYIAALKGDPHFPYFNREYSQVFYPGAKENYLDKVGKYLTNCGSSSEFYKFRNYIDTLAKMPTPQEPSPPPQPQQPDLMDQAIANLGRTRPVSGGGGSSAARELTPEEKKLAELKAQYEAAYDEAEKSFDTADKATSDRLAAQAGKLKNQYQDLYYQLYPPEQSSPSAQQTPATTQTSPANPSTPNQTTQTAQPIQPPPAPSTPSLATPNQPTTPPASPPPPSNPAPNPTTPSNNQPHLNPTAPSASPVTSRRSQIFNRAGNIGKSTLNSGYKLGGQGAKLAANAGKRLAVGLARGALFSTPIGWIIIGVFVGMLALMIFFYILKGGTLFPPTEALAGTPVDTITCDTSGFDILNGNAVSDEKINKFIEQQKALGYVKNEDQFRQRAFFIRDEAKAAGLNPAIFLGYWKSESLFSNYDIEGTRPGMDLGCDPLNRELRSFEDSVRCAVGRSSISNSRTSQCAVSRDANSSACQAIAFQVSQDGITLPINTLKEFLDSYGSKVADPNNTNSDRVVHQVISDLGLAKCTISGGGGSATICSGNAISLPAGIVTQKILLPLPHENSVCPTTLTSTCGRPGYCTVPHKIVLHITASNANALNTYQFFASGANTSQGLAGTGSHFIADKDGGMLQAVELLDDKVEIAYAVANYSDHISIEMVSSKIFNNRDDVPQAQYQSTLRLVKALMQQYNIPVGGVSFDWLANNGSSDAPTSAATPGIYGHYQLNPIGRSSGEPGKYFIRDFKEDLAKP